MAVPSSRALLLAVAAAALAGALPTASASAVDLTAASFDAQVLEAGKSAFVKFYAPWCGHCKAIAPVWDGLGADFDGSKSVLIGSVDCTEEGDLCSRFDVTGYPTLLSFTAAAPEGTKYTGGRDADALKAFVEEELGGGCNIDEPYETCSEREQGYVIKMSAAGKDKVAAQKERLAKMRGETMAPELKAWVNQRYAILAQM